jgi:hypothetical protein
LKKAKELADTIDAANGFSKPEGAKGQANYGPKRQVLNSRLTEARRIFGVLKQAPSVLTGVGYWAGVAKARKWLADNGKTWDGDNILDDATKAKRAAVELETAALASVVADIPQKEGETRLDYLQRIDKAAQVQKAVLQGMALEDRVKKIAASMLKQFGDEMPALLRACDYILDEDARMAVAQSFRQESP